MKTLTKKYRISRIESKIAIKDFRKRNLKRDKNSAYLLNVLRERNKAELFIDKVGGDVNQLLQQYVWGLEYDIFSLSRHPSDNAWGVVSYSLYAVSRKVGDLLNNFLGFRDYTLLDNRAKIQPTYENEYVKKMIASHNKNVTLVNRLKLILSESQGKASVNPDRTLEVILIKELENADLGDYQC